MAKLRRRGRGGGNRRRSELLEFLHRKLGGNRSGDPRPFLAIKVPESFSFIEKPRAAIQCMRAIVRGFVKGRARRATINQEKCNLIDHGAESLVGALAVEAKSSLGASFAGTFPKDQDLRAIIIATGVPRSLGVPLPEPPGFLKFPLFRGRGQKTKDQKRSGLAEKKSWELASYVNECLEEYGFQLTFNARWRLSSLVGEVMGNAEEHSGRKQWWVSAYLRRLEGASYGDCHISIFCFGRSIAETMAELPPESYHAQDLKELISIHSSRTLFSPRVWEPDNLRTLFALQEGVSRFNVDPGDELDRGKGTADLIRFFDHLGQTSSGTRPKMCLTSGHTHVVFDGRYTMQPGQNGNGIIALNDQNDLRRQPDPQALMYLKRPFPGTMISLRFYLDPVNLEALHEKGRENE